MKREEAIDILFGCIEAHSEEENEALDMAIEALESEPSEDGTLEVKVEDATKVGRVLISDDEHRGGLYYPDEDEPKGDLISRAEAIKAIEIVDWYHQNRNKDMVHGANDDEHQAWYKAQDIYKALEAVPSADRPMVIKCKPFLSEEDFKAFAKQVSDQNVILISNEADVVSTNTSTKSTNISTDASADRPRSEQYKKGFEDAKRAFLVEYARESENMRKRNAQLEVMLNAQKAISADRPRGEFDGMIFSTDKYMAFIDKKEIHIMRKGSHKVTIERTFNTEEDEK